MAHRVHLVRHGEVENPEHVVYADLPHFGLSEAGNVQAAEAADYLADRSIAAVFSSPLTRAVQTARVIGERHGLRVQVVEQLTEFRLSIRWRGVRWNDLPEEFPGEVEAYLENPWDLPFSPESLAEMAGRMKEAIVTAHAAYPDGEIVVVSHQDPLQAARVSLTDRDPSTFPVNKPEHAQVITLEPGRPWQETGIWEPSIKSGPFPPPGGS